MAQLGCFPVWIDHFTSFLLKQNVWRQIISLSSPLMAAGICFDHRLTACLLDRQFVSRVNQWRVHFREIWEQIQYTPENNWLNFGSLELGWFRVVLDPVYTIQPVVKPVVQPVWNRLYNRSYMFTQRERLDAGLHESNRLNSYNQLKNRFDNRLNVCVHDTTGC